MVLHRSPDAPAQLGHSVFEANDQHPGADEMDEVISTGCDNADSATVALMLEGKRAQLVSHRAMISSRRLCGLPRTMGAI